MHQAIGSDYETRAACQLSFRELIDQQTSRIHGHAKLTCISGPSVGISFGTLEYWARLIVPVDQAFRAYKERTKALGYLASDARASEQINQSKLMNQKSKSNDNMNELNINILRCSKLQSLASKVQPAPYCVYKFYDFADHDTEIIKSTNNPEFNDHKSFAVPMDIDLDKYLKSDCLEIYVFDDNQDENDPNYLGMAKVPLIGLAHDKDIKGTFELSKLDGTSNGTIDVTLYWQYSYLPPSASTFSAMGSKQPTSSKSTTPAHVSLMPGEHLEQPMSLAQKAEKMGVKFTQPKEKPKTPSGSVSGSKQPSPAASKQPSIAGSKRGSIVSNKSEEVSVREENSLGNSTLRQKPDIMSQMGEARPVSQQSSHGSQGTFSVTPNIHYNDTMFGDEPGRTYSPNELDSLSKQYQNNVHSDEEQGPRESRDQEINEEIEEEEEEEEEEEVEQSENNFRNYNATTKSEDDVVIGEESWDPHNTNRLAKEGNEDNVIIEIQSFVLKENSQVLKRDEIQRLFVSMEFLDYDSSELESNNTMAKPEANQPVHFNFRKSIFFCWEKLFKNFNFKIYLFL